MDSMRERLPGLQTIAEREALLLAPYATFSHQSRGRRYAEAEHPYRGPFQRDRDRILHSSAYRRLSGKTQVFTGEMGDYHRTRLTHTQEVASIARTIGRALRLNEDLIEALALFHDIGHPPYGHAGEDALDDCLAENGGFSHNQHALTIVEELEVRYHDFPGLNLTHEVLAGQAARADKQSGRAGPSLEVQVVDLADSITYDAHDADDALQLGILSIDQLSANELIAQLLARVRARYSDLSGDMLRNVLVHELIDVQVSDVLRENGRLLAERQFQSSQEAADADFRLEPSAELRPKKRELEAFLYQQVYRHPTLLGVRTAAQQRLREMFAFYLERPELLPRRFQRRVPQIGLPRSIGEYLAGMTDRFCDHVYQKHFGR